MVCAGDVLGERQPELQWCCTCAVAMKPGLHPGKDDAVLCQEEVPALMHHQGSKWVHSCEGQALQELPGCPMDFFSCPPGVVCWGKDSEALGLLLDKLGCCRFPLAFSDLREVVGLRPL